MKSLFILLLCAISLSSSSQTFSKTDSGWQPWHNYDKAYITQMDSAIKRKLIHVDTVATMVSTMTGKSHTSNVKGLPAYPVTTGYIILWNNTVLYWLDKNKQPIINTAKTDSVTGIYIYRRKR